VNTSPDIVEDACGYAWAEFIRCQPDRDRSWRAWLIVTAQRQAWKLHAKEANHVGFGHGDEDELVRDAIDPRDTLTLRSELRATLDLLAAVSERRRLVKAMHVTGYSYEEIAGRMGLGPARVNALITEANAAIRREHARVAPEQQPRTERAERLRALEQQPPKWLVKVVGRVPWRSENAGALLAWRRAALAVDDYRREHAPDFDGEHLGRRPDDERAARAYDLAYRAVVRSRESRQIERGRSLER
jgi:DNA-directed RNA polymerase specialized sigma24 family protein